MTVSTFERLFRGSLEHCWARCRGLFGEQSLGGIRGRDRTDYDHPKVFEEVFQGIDHGRHIPDDGCPTGPRTSGRLPEKLGYKALPGNDDPEKQLEQP